MSLLPTAKDHPDPTTDATEHALAWDGAEPPRSFSFGADSPAPASANIARSMTRESIPS